MVEPCFRIGAKPIVVGTDGSASATEAVCQAAALARTAGAVLHIVGACPAATAPETFAMLESVAERVDDGHTRIFLHTVVAEPATALCWLASCKDAAMIVVGNRGACGRPRRARRPICKQVERHAPCPVVTVDTRTLWAT